MRKRRKGKYYFVINFVNFLENVNWFIKENKILFILCKVIIGSEGEEC